MPKQKTRFSISPPPGKRRKISPQPASLQTAPSLQCPPTLPTVNAKNIRIFSWNINGISPFLQKSLTSFFSTTKSGGTGSQVDDGIPPASIRGFLQRHKWPDILFLQEVKIAAKDEKTQNTIRRAINTRTPSEHGASETQAPAYEAYFTLPNDHFNARGLGGSGKVYGVSSIIRKDVLSRYDVRVRTVDWDREGRVSVVELRTPSLKLAAFNIYAVNGTENPYRDPRTGSIRGTRHDRKLQFHSLLMQECLELEKEGWEVLLAGDMNVAPDTRDGYPKLRTFPEQHVMNRADFHRKLLAKDDSETGFEGVDTWRKMHSEGKRYTYFPRGRKWGTICDRVDYFIAGKGIWGKGMVEACGILDSEAERGPSDHVPIWADIKLE